MSLIDDIVKAIEAREKKPRGYDSEAKVVRIDGDTAYVHLPGGVPETPVKRTISCKVGDKVQVRVSGGRATITGNATAPPTDDTKAEAADGKAVEAEKTAQSALEKALEGIKLTDAQAERLTSFFSEFIKDNLIRAEKIDADSLHVKAANVDGTLTARQINGDGLSVTNGKFGGNVTASSLTAKDYVSVYVKADGRTIEKKVIAADNWAEQLTHEHHQSRVAFGFVDEGCYMFLAKALSGDQTGLDYYMGIHYPDGSEDIIN